MNGLRVFSEWLRVKSVHFKKQKKKTLSLHNYTYIHATYLRVDLRKSTKYQNEHESVLSLKLA